MSTTRTSTSRGRTAIPAALLRRRLWRELLAAAALPALALTFALALPDSTNAADEKDPRYSDQRLAKWLKKELRGGGLKPKGVSSCHPKRAKKVLVCRWRAKGFLPDGTPYECAGRARFTVKKKQWAIDPCDNLKEPMMPLRAAPGPHPLFGFNEDWNLNLDKLDLISGTGANIARQGLFWDAVERDPGTGYDWSEMDAIYHGFLARGIRPLWVLYAAPCWAQSGSCRTGAHPAEQFYDEFAAFAAAAANRYPEAVGFEIWNEPNYRIYWGGDPDPESYARMIQAVAPAIKAADPTVPVLTAGLSPHIDTEANAMAYAEFLRRVYDSGAPGYTDAIGAHPYPNRRYSEDYLGNIRVNLYRTFDIMQSHGEASKPIWVTETGVSNAGDESFTPDQQAEALAKIYELIRLVDHDIPVVVFHRFSDQPGHPRVDERGYGVVTGSGQPKPAYCAVAAARERPC
jgi:polysaccharide biosynthesis protein PslG